MKAVHTQTNLTLWVVCQFLDKFASVVNRETLNLRSVLYNVFSFFFSEEPQQRATMWCEV